MKVVINKCYGGFSPSTELFEYLINEKGWKLTQYKGNTYEDPKADIVKADGMSMSDYYFVHREDDQDLRSNPDLVEAVEKLGEKASASVSRLEVVEIPDDVNYEIEEYDGLEHIAEKHRTWG
jgi:hypothetical protein